MNLYSIHFSDHPKDPLRVFADDRTEAEIKGKAYAERWHIQAEIISIRKEKRAYEL